RFIRRTTRATCRRWSTRTTEWRQARAIRRRGTASRPRAIRVADADSIADARERRRPEALAELREVEALRRRLRTLGVVAGVRVGRRAADRPDGPVHDA